MGIHACYCQDHWPATGCGPSIVLSGHPTTFSCSVAIFFFSSIGRREDLWKERERKEGSRQKIQTNHEPRLVQPLYSLQQLLYSEPFRLPSDQAFLSAYTGNIPPDFYSQNMVFYPIYTYFLYIYV